MQSSTRRTIIAAAAAVSLVPAVTTAAETANSQEKGTLVSQAGHKVNFDKISNLKGFDTGTGEPANPRVYVFFDPQCGHCANLWQAHKALRTHFNFRWIPVALLNRASLAQGATILGAKDPVAAMDEHEKLLTERRGGITADASAIKKYEELIKSYREVMIAMGASGIPFIAYKNKQGEAVTTVGAMTTPVLAGFLGLANPLNQAANGAQAK